MTENKHCGYYSVIQYCPDRSLMECVSVGVLMFCPDLKFAGARLTQNYLRRIKKFFGTTVPKNGFLDTYIKGLEHHFDKKLPQSTSFEDIQRYLRKSFVNLIHFTDIGTTLVTNPEQDLDALFKRLFKTVN